jgi:Leucine-rich repeat (LRR) protein
MLRLDRNLLSGPLPALLLESAGSALEYVDLSENHFSGAIPSSSVGSLVALQKLYLYDCSLTGTVPLEFGTLSTLHELRLDSNQLEGRVPAFASRIVASLWAEDHPTELFVDTLSWQQQMLSIEYLDLHGNRLSGTLPSSFSTLTSLKELHLYSNRITGSIPGQFSLLQSLKALRLDGNSIGGRVPPQLSQLKKLKYLGLGGKNMKLIGRLPDFKSNNGQNIAPQEKSCHLRWVSNSTRHRSMFRNNRTWNSHT